MNVKCTLFDGKEHPVDSSQIAFQIAGEQCLQEAARNAGIVLLEPIMEVNVQSPGQYIGDLTGDTSRRRGENPELGFKGPCPTARLHPAGHPVRLQLRSA